MAWCVRLRVNEGSEALRVAMPRYALLERLWDACVKQDVTLLAFGLASDEVRILLEGEVSGAANVARGVRVGTVSDARSRGSVLTFAETERWTAESLEDGVVWAHQAVLGDGTAGPLASPWSSHRDLLGFRDAAFYDPDPLDGRVDVARIHARTGGRALPGGPVTPRPNTPVSLVLRVAASVLGLLPSDRRSFALAAQLAAACGWSTRDVAEALMLSRRRVRQLRHEPMAPVGLGLIALADPRLCVVP